MSEDILPSADAPENKSSQASWRNASPALLKRTGKSAIRFGLKIAQAPFKLCLKHPVISAIAVLSIPYGATAGLLTIEFGLMKGIGPSQALIGIEDTFKNTPYDFLIPTHKWLVIGGVLGWCGTMATGMAGVMGYLGSKRAIKTARASFEELATYNAGDRAYFYVMLANKYKDPVFTENAEQFLEMPIAVPVSPEVAAQRARVAKQMGQKIAVVVKERWPHRAEAIRALALGD